MSRCAICDHEDGYGSDLTLKYSLRNKVRWNDKRQEFMCGDCRSSINETIHENNFFDYNPDDSHDLFPTIRDKSGY